MSTKWVDCESGNGVRSRLANKDRTSLQCSSMSKKVHLNGGDNTEDGDHFITLREEMGGGSAKLMRWLCGMRSAAHHWETGPLLPSIECGHGPRQGGTDNFPQCGDFNSMRGSWRRFHIRWPAKRRAADDAVGEGLDDDTAISLLNRLTKCESDSIEFEADLQTPLAYHGALRFGGGGQRAHGAYHQGRCWRRRRRADEAGIDGESKSGSRERIIGATYPADIQFAVIEEEFRRTKRLARHLKGAKAATIAGNPEAEAVRKIVVYVDNDWCGCKTSRKSTSGRCWSSVATSSGQAEYNALVRGAADALLGFEGCVGGAGLGDAYRHHDRLGRTSR